MRQRGTFLPSEAMIEDRKDADWAKSTKSFVCVWGAETAGVYFLLKIPLYHQVGSYDYTLHPVK